MMMHSDFKMPEDKHDHAKDNVKSKAEVFMELKHGKKAGEKLFSTSKATNKRCVWPTGWCSNPIPSLCVRQGTFL